jgi:rhamnulokinase
MVTPTSLLAVDLGASSGRVSRGVLEGSRIRIEEVHRFTTPVIAAESGTFWDLASLTNEVEYGISSAMGDSTAISVGVDAWGVDYGLLDEHGRLLRAPFHHRDARTAGVSERLDSAFLFQRTGVQCQDINTLTQLLTEDDATLRQATTLLFMPDLLAYRLSGACATDPTIASTSQLVTPEGEIAGDVIARYGLPDLLPPVVPSGTVIGTVRRDLATSGQQPLAVTTIAGHDTACAVAAIPASETPVAFVSCGTWAVVGLELERPILTERAREAGFTNEVGYRSHHLLRNATGLWLLNECIREWGGTPMSAAPELAAAAATVPAFRSIIDPLDPAFIRPGDMVARISAQCARRGQPIPNSKAAVVRCILDGLALSFAHTLLEAADIADAHPRAVHIVGGGARITLLCEMTASLTGLPVVAGPVEAATLGNVVIQMAALELADAAQASALLGASVSTVTHEPRHLDSGDAATLTYRDLIALRGSAS